MYVSSRSFLSSMATAVVVAISSSTTRLLVTNAFVQRSRSTMLPMVTMSPSRSMAASSTLSMSTGTAEEDKKVILVTGSSRGLGKSIATHIGAEGHNMIINYVSDGSKEAAEATVQEIIDAGGDAIAIQADCKCYYTC